MMNETERLMAMCWQRQGYGQTLAEAIDDLCGCGFSPDAVYLAWIAVELYGSELFRDEPPPSSTGPR